MPQYPWREFLAEWSRETLADPELREQLPPEAVANEWLGYPGASEVELAALEHRLGRSLPPSYRQFLAVSNGWRLPGSLIPRVLPCAEVEWFTKNDPEGVEIIRVEYAYPWSDDEEYFDYGNDKGVESMRSEYVPFTLQISEVERTGTAVYLLNPKVINADGEWEAWHYAHWNPGVVRFRSFWHMMRWERGIA